MPRMSRGDLAATLLCVLLWGLNFVVIALGLRDFPPLLFASLRFLIAAVPAVLLVPRPGVGWRRVVGIGLLMGVIQFGALFVAIRLGLSAGLASVVAQSQVVFTALISAAALRERPRRAQIAGLVVAVTGLGAIGIGAGPGGSVIGFALCLLAGAAWGGGNVLTRATRPRRPFSLLVYSSAVAPVPLLGLSLLLEGPANDAAAVLHLDLPGVAALLYVAVAATLVGFGLWYRLLSRYPTDVVAPFTVLVPVVGLLSAWSVLNEVPSPLDLAGAGMAIAGLIVIHLAGDGTRGSGRAIRLRRRARSSLAPGRVKSSRSDAQQV
jgi:O-acetylserine/cysteine efflux transporter